MNLNGAQENKKKFYRWKFSFCILRSSNVIQPGNFTSLNNDTARLVKKLKNLHKIRDRQIQEDASFTKLDGIKDTTNDSLST